MPAPKDGQIVIRVPADLLAAIREHQGALQAARPFEHVTLATAARDLLARGIAAAKPRKR